MGHIKYASDVGAPAEVAFTYTDNHLSVPDWMFGVRAFEPAGDIDQGVGAVFAITSRLWPRPISCEITEHRRNAVLSYTLRGRRLRGTLTLRFDPLGYGRSVLTSEARYEKPSGPVGRMCSGLVEAAVRRALRRTEAQLRREIEEFHGTDLVGRIA